MHQTGRREWTWGEAPLHRAAAIGRNDILRLLVEAGGNLKSYSIHDNDDKLTCLHLAVWCNQTETVKLLLQLGGDPAMPGTWLDYTGTPWDFALQYKHSEILELFKEHDKEGRFTSAKMLTGSKFGASHQGGQPIVNRVSTSAILTGLENLGTKEKALKKATELQAKHTRAEKNLQECKKRLAVAEKEMFDIESNPYFLSLDQIDALTMEIEELKVFSVEVRKVLGESSGHHRRRADDGHSHV